MCVYVCVCVCVSCFASCLHCCSYCCSAVVVFCDVVVVTVVLFVFIISKMDLVIRGKFPFSKIVNLIIYSPVSIHLPNSNL